MTSDFGNTIDTIGLLFAIIAGIIAVGMIWVGIGELIVRWLDWRRRMVDEIFGPAADWFHFPVIDLLSGVALVSVMIEGLMAAGARLVGRLDVFGTWLGGKVVH